MVFFSPAGCSELCHGRRRGRPVVWVFRAGPGLRRPFPAKPLPAASPTKWFAHTSLATAQLRELCAYQVTATPAPLRSPAGAVAGVLPSLVASEMHLLWEGRMEARRLPSSPSATRVGVSVFSVSPPLLRGVRLARGPTHHLLPTAWPGTAPGGVQREARKINVNCCFQFKHQMSRFLPL